MSGFTFEVLVFLKAGLADPQGKAIEGSLPTLGYRGVSDVHVGKHIRLTIDAPDEAEARDRVDDIARRILANPVIEDFRVLEAESA